ncbi:hypothetical protein NUW54_g6664 [Trametes sanguinea]|uniref:Uncharacterized protein n=1 Tax=Trametes sanguinea TaxID=158606 RepID=A0ACC1PT97_9APHY|nr:hypothetical protein NUW54_g6664 [Trametes sanguinea]
MGVECDRRTHFSKLAMSSTSPDSSAAVTTKAYLHHLIIGFAFSAVLYGITVMQAYVYFRRYPKDVIWLKIFVAVLLVLDTLTTAFAGQGLHTYAVDDYEQPEKLGSLTWSLITENYLSIVTAAVVEFYYAHCLWIISRGNRPLTAIIAFLALVSLGTGTWIVADMFMAPGLALYGSIAPRAVSSVCSGCRSVADVIISASLFYYLHTNKSGIKQSDVLIDKLMMYAIQRGLLTAVVQAFETITCFPDLACVPPGHADAQQACVFLLSCTVDICLTVKVVFTVYTNALLATLNVRNALKAESTGGGNVISLESRPVFTRGGNSVVERDADLNTIHSRALEHGHVSGGDGDALAVLLFRHHRSPPRRTQPASSATAIDIKGASLVDEVHLRSLTIHSVLDPRPPQEPHRHERVPHHPRAHDGLPQRRLDDTALDEPAPRSEAHHEHAHGRHDDARRRTGWRTTRVGPRGDELVLLEDRELEGEVPPERAVAHGASRNVSPGRLIAQTQARRPWAVIHVASNLYDNMLSGPARRNG